VVPVGQKIGGQLTRSQRGRADKRIKKINEKNKKGAYVYICTMGNHFFPPGAHRGNKVCTFWDN
jgi:hypothetical protein